MSVFYTCTSDFFNDLHEIDTTNKLIRFLISKLVENYKNIMDEYIDANQLKRKTVYQNTLAENYFRLESAISDICSIHKRSARYDIIDDIIFHFKRDFNVSLILAGKADLAPGQQRDIFDSWCVDENYDEDADEDEEEREVNLRYNKYRNDIKFSILASLVSTNSVTVEILRDGLAFAKRNNAPKEMIEYLENKCNILEPSDNDETLESNYSTDSSVYEIVRDVKQYIAVFDETVEFGVPETVLDYLCESGISVNDFISKMEYLKNSTHDEIARVHAQDFLTGLCDLLLNSPEKVAYDKSYLKIIEDIFLREHDSYSVKYIASNSLLPYSMQKLILDCYSDLYDELIKNPNLALPILKEIYKKDSSLKRHRRIEMKKLKTNQRR